jgi:hypothetical protein
MDDREATRAVFALTDGGELQEFEKLLDVEVGMASISEARPAADVVVGTLAGFTDNGTTALVTYVGQPANAALHARTTVDLHATHIGRDVVLMFEGGDPSRPIIVGCIKGAGGQSSPEVSGKVEVDADGERLVVSANHGLVLRCGKASITLSPEGKIVIRGTHVVSHASGLNRIKGGSVQVN